MAADLPLFERLAIIGRGLIGSSIAPGARATGAARQIAIYDASPQARARIAELGLADEVSETAAQAVTGADLVVFATPVRAIGEAARACATALKPGAIVTDVGSVKAAVAEALTEAVPDAGFAELFHRRWVILTPQAREDDAYLEAVQRLADFWTALGAEVERMDEKHHDLVLAVTSHLPHLIAYNIVGTAADMEEVTRAEAMKYSAGGFRDFTRIAASDPTMWRDIF